MISPGWCSTCCGRANAKAIGPAGQDQFQTAAILMGGVNQVIITWLLYRRPRNLTKASIEIVERMLDMIAAEKSAG